MTRVRLTVAYDGSGFHGFWPNPGVATVGGTLQAALEQILGHPISLVCAGRTDAGVHAWGQVVSGWGRCRSGRRGRLPSGLRSWNPVSVRLAW